MLKHANKPIAKNEKKIVYDSTNASLHLKGIFRDKINWNTPNYIALNECTKCPKDNTALDWKHDDIPNANNGEK